MENKENKENYNVYLGRKKNYFKRLMDKIASDTQFLSIKKI